jgi:hypothetical protein
VDEPTSVRQHGQNCGYAPISMKEPEEDVRTIWEASDMAVTIIRRWVKDQSGIIGVQSE